MNRLLAIGFQPAGHWLIENRELTFELIRHAQQRNILYAFVSDGDVMYVGKTIRPLRQRLSGYKRPAAGQSTNINNHARIKSLLESGAAVDILALPDNGLHHYGQFHLNLAAGLEDSIIAIVQPEWNGGRPEPIDPDPGPAPDPSVLHTFRLILQPTYHRQGFFNVGVADAGHFAADGEAIEILCGDDDQPLLGTINRTANANRTPRIMGGRGLREWFQQTAEPMQALVIDVLAPTTIRIRGA